MKVRYRFRLYPTPEQAHVLARTFGAVRYVYNWGLHLRKDAYEAGGKIGYVLSDSMLTDLKDQPGQEWMSEISSVPMQQALRHLQTAYVNFFDGRSDYPSWKSKRGDQAAEYTRSAFTWHGPSRSLIVAKVGRLKVRWSRTFASTPSSVTIAKHADGRYFVTLVLDETIKPLPKTGRSVGIDLGISALATLSTGERVENPRHLDRRARQLAHAQRVLARRRKGSGRWRRQKRVVARLYSRVADARADFLHKATTDVVRRFDLICMEDLAVRNMVRNRHLARAMHDAGLGTFDLFVGYKSRWYGKEQRHIGQWFPSSKRCSVCGWLNESLTLADREWTCPICGTHHDRDQNAAKNIELEGLALSAAGHAVVARGGSVRRTSASAEGRGARRAVNRLSCRRAPHDATSGIPRL